MERACSDVQHTITVAIISSFVIKYGGDFGHEIVPFLAYFFVRIPPSILLRLPSILRRLAVLAAIYVAIT